MKGLNYFKGKDDIVAMKDEEYPEWLWRCLDVKDKKEEKGANAGDEFGMLTPLLAQKTTCDAVLREE